MKVTLLRTASIALALSASAAVLPLAAHAQPAEKAAPAEAAAPAVPDTAGETQPAGTAANADQAAATDAAAPEAGAKSPSDFPNEEPPKMHWTFDGPFGYYDRASLQRGFQIYSQVCSGCHSMNRMHYRDIEALGYSEDQVKTIAAAKNVQDGPNDEGEMFERPGRPSDWFVSPFPNAKAAAYANNGAVPPDMSLLAKAREGGPSYIYGILTGYEQAPEGVKLLATQHWNKYMPGHVIAMPQPIAEGAVQYEDGSPQTLDQYAKDIATFLAWASEPHMEERKRTGIKVFLFLSIFAGVLYMAKRKVWQNVPH
jgi:ubiquinol-cytochrome c reductase cytochrome c1 subunit